MPLNPKSLERYARELSRKVASIKIDRRRFLQGSFAVAGVNAFPFGFTERAHFHMDGSRAVFLLDGKPAWIIDPKVFAGEPLLKILAHNSNEIAFSLSDALYPGTHISADLLCQIRRSLGTWICKIELPAHAWSASTDLISWLVGEPLRFVMSSGLSLFTSSPFTVHLLGGHAKLNSSWVVDFEAATLKLPGSSLLKGGRTTLVLSSEDRHPVLDEPGKGSAISVLRGGHNWRAESELLQRNGWKLNGASEPFDVLQLDAFESPAGDALLSAVFAPAKAAIQHLDIPGALRDLNGGPFSFSLERPVYAIVSDGENSIKATFSSPLSSEMIAVAPGRALRFADKVTLTADLRNSAVPDAIDAGLQQIYCEQFAADDDAIFDFLVSGNHANLTSCPTSMPLDDVTLRVTRPKDFLYLNFTFVNAELDFLPRNLPYLVPQDVHKPIIMIVHFPPQHMQEETFEENSKGEADGPEPARPVELTLAKSNASSVRSQYRFRRS